MKKLTFFLTIILCISFICCKTSGNNDNNNNGNGNNNDNGGSTTPASAFIIDHNCTDISRIPGQWLQQASAQFRIHYAHTSHGDDAGHTTFQSCENKAYASWWLMARLAGWDGANASEF